MFKDLKDKIQKLNKGNNTIINISTWIFIAVIVTFVFYLIWIGSQNIYYSLFNSEKAGQIGDSAGLLNSLFSGLAFLGVIVTIILQSKELKQTTTELKNQKIEFEKQNQTLKRQQFENTFFNMLSLQQNIIDNLEYGLRGSNKYCTSRKVFQVLSEDYFLFLQHKIKEGEIHDINNKEEIIVVTENFKNRILLDHYFRHMYRIIKFVKDTELIDSKSKNEYIDILRSTLSPYELVLLYYNSFLYEKMKVFIDEYDILDNLREELLFDETKNYLGYAW